MIMLAGRTLMKSAKRFRSCDNYDRRWAAGEASISEVDGSRESSRLLLPLLSDIAAVPGRGVSAATANCVNYDQNCVGHDGAVTSRNWMDWYVVADLPAVTRKTDGRSTLRYLTTHSDVNNSWNLHL
jgi:hypothetical protein